MLWLVLRGESIQLAIHKEVAKMIMNTIQLMEANMC